MLPGDGKLHRVLRAQRRAGPPLGIAHAGVQIAVGVVDNRLGVINKRFIHQPECKFARSGVVFHQERRSTPTEAEDGHHLRGVGKVGVVLGVVLMIDQKYRAARADIGIGHVGPFLIGKVAIPGLAGIDLLPVAEHKEVSRRI